jgi:hypothetical protein
VSSPAFRPPQSREGTPFPRGPQWVLRPIYGSPSSPATTARMSSCERPVNEARPGRGIRSRVVRVKVCSRRQAREGSYEEESGCTARGWHARGCRRSTRARSAESGRHRTAWGRVRRGGGDDGACGLSNCRLCTCGDCLRRERRHPLPRERERPCGFPIRHRLLPGDVEPLEVWS